MPKSRTTLAVILFLAAVIALMVYSSLGLAAYTCEVCMDFQGQSKCRSASGSTEQEALKTAIDNACAFLSSGVTETIGCANTPPTSAKCRPGR